MEEAGVSDLLSQTGSLPGALCPVVHSNSTSDLVAAEEEEEELRKRASACDSAPSDSGSGAHSAVDDGTWPEGLRRRLERRANGEASAAEVEGEEGVHGPVPARGEDTEGKSKKKARRRVSSPVHTELRESPLSSDAIFKQSHAGLVNLCIVVLVAVNSRLIIENLLKYGILIRANFWFVVAAWRDWPLMVCGLTLALFPLNALLIEWLKVRSKLPNQIIVVLHVVNIAVELFYPAIVICSLEQVQPLGGFILMFVAVIMMMKLISYAHTNHDLHQCFAQGNPVEEEVAGGSPLRYPDNLTLGNMLYFCAAPTLCYQMGYPRTREIRKAILLRQIVLLLSFLCLMLIIIEQYINPIIKNSKHPFKGHLVESVERVLRLSIPTLYVWLCVFFVFFHLWLNILAEVLRFGDRDFYRDWWNARTIEEYWRLWNMPVHRWMARHIYFPCIGAGLNRNVAMFLVFFLSAVFHEVLIGIPCRMFRLWAFLGMFFQIPLVSITTFLYKKYRSPTVGNMLFWFFFCIVGQPMCVLLYYHDVQLQMSGRQLVAP